MTKKFYIYRLTSPSGKCYIGYTGQTVKERFRQHVVKALNGVKHPLSSALRKYGADAFKVETLSAHSTSEDAFAEEIAQIASHPKGYNLSPGGEGDLPSGREAFKKKLSDPEWRAEYVKRLSVAIKNSELHKASWAAFPDKAAKWREENPEEAERIQKKATAAARLVSLGRPSWNSGGTHTPEACAKMSASQIAFWANATPEILAKKSVSSTRGAKKQWAQRTPEERAAVGRKISETLKRKNAAMTPEELAKRDAILAETRKHIDHKFRLEQQAKAFEEYWSEERRAAKGEWSKARWAKLKAEAEENNENL